MLFFSETIKGLLIFSIMKPAIKNNESVFWALDIHIWFRRNNCFLNAFSIDSTLGEGCWALHLTRSLLKDVLASKLIWGREFGYSALFTSTLHKACLSTCFPMSLPNPHYFLALCLTIQLNGCYLFLELVLCCGSRHCQASLVSLLADITQAFSIIYLLSIALIVIILVSFFILIDLFWRLFSDSLTWFLINWFSSLSVFLFHMSDYQCLFQWNHSYLEICFDELLFLNHNIIKSFLPFSYLPLSPVMYHFAPSQIRDPFSQSEFWQQTLKA